MSTATIEQRDATERYITDLEKRLAELEDAARRVCWFDWSDNDEDAVDAVARLREIVGPEQPFDDPINA